MSSLHSLDLTRNSPTSPWVSAVAADASTRRRSITEEMTAPRSFPSRLGGNHLSTNPSPSREVDLMKKALAQLYSSCTRSQSFGDVFLSKIETKKDEPPSVDHSHEKAVAKNFVDSTLTPLSEASESETIASSDGVRSNYQHGANGNNDETRIDWKMAFDYFDHRRLITVGVVRGLITRVHQYPLAYEVEKDSNDANTSGTGRESTTSSHVVDDDDDFSHMELSTEQHHVPIEMSTVAEAAAALARTSVDERSRKTSFSASPLLHSMSPQPINSIDEMLLNKLAQKEILLQARKLLLERIALAMDGTRCDDELSCMFEVPIEKLVEMLKETGRWDVISVYSCKK